MKSDTLTLSGADTISLISNLSTMLSAGIPIIETVDSILSDATGNQQKLLEVLREDLMQGNSISSSFAKFPLVFNSVTVNVIHASEEAGTLDVTLKDLRLSIQKEMEFSDKVKTALLYPIFIIVVFFLVLLLMLLFVVPKISDVFSRLQVDLPLPTKLLIFASQALITYPLPVITGIGGALLVIFSLYKKNKPLFLSFFVNLPFLSHLIEEIDLTRFSRSMYLLLSSGLPITAALDLTADVVIKKQTNNLIRSSRDMILAGKTLSEGFRQAKSKMPIIMIKLIEAGEKTGSLDKSMQDISEYFDYQVSTTLKILMALLEPVMLVLIGGVVGSMMLAIITPIYGLISNVGAR